MKRLLAILVALGCATVYSNAQATNEITAILPPVQSELMPTIGTYYLMRPPDVYKAIGEPGPANSKMNTAWSLGNEFIYRTILRADVNLPYTSVGLISNDLYTVGLMNSEGRMLGALTVNITNHAVMLSEWKQPQQGVPGYRRQSAPQPER